MRYTHWVRTRMRRLLTVLLALLVYSLLLTVDGLRFFPQKVVESSFLLWLRFGFSALVALLFLAIGTLVWLYARNRHVALLLFCLHFYYYFSQKAIFHQVPFRERSLSCTNGTIPRCYCAGI